MRVTKRVAVFAIAVVVASMTLLTGTALASKNCPSGSIYVGGRDGGKCIDTETDEVVKVIINVD